MNSIIDPNLKPKFTVGEKVMLVSADHPHKNGTYYIDGMTQWWNIENNVKGVIWAYTLAGVSNDNIYNLWNETALRKLPPTGSSFETIMDNLKLDIGEPA